MDFINQATGYPVFKGTKMSDQQPDPNTKPYRGHQIRLQSDWTFRVTGPEFDESKYNITFSSLRTAREEIEKRVADAERIAAKNLTFSAVVYDELGNREEITRINRQSGNLAGATSAGSIETKYVYPRVDWIVESLRRRRQIQKELDQIDTALRDVRISVSRAFSGRISADEYPNKILAFQRELNEATEKAKKLTTPAEVTDTKAEAQTG